MAFNPEYQQDVGFDAAAKKKYSIVQSLVAAMEAAQDEPDEDEFPSYNEFMSVYNQKRGRTDAPAPEGEPKSLFSTIVDRPQASSQWSNAAGYRETPEGGVFPLRAGAGGAFPIGMTGKRPGVELDSHVKDILEKAALDMEPLTEVEIGELRGSLVASVRSSPNPRPIVEKYVAILKNHRDCNRVFSGIVNNPETFLATEQPGGGGQDETRGAIFTDFSQEVAPKQAGAAQLAEAESGGIKRKTLFEIVHAATQAALAGARGHMASGPVLEDFGEPYGSTPGRGAAPPPFGAPVPIHRVLLGDRGDVNPLARMASQDITKRGIGSVYDEIFLGVPKPVLPGALGEDGGEMEYGTVEGFEHEISHYGVQPLAAPEQEAARWDDQTYGDAFGYGAFEPKPLLPETAPRLGRARPTPYDAPAPMGFRGPRPFMSARVGAPMGAGVGGFGMRMRGPGPMMRRGMMGGPGPFFGRPRPGFMGVPPGGPGFRMRGAAIPMRGQMRPLAPFKADSGTSGKGYGGWTASVPPHRRHLFDLSTIPSPRYVDLALYKCVRRAYENQDPDVADIKNIRDSFKSMLNHGVNPFPVLAMYGTFLPHKLMERLLSDSNKQLLTDAAKNWGVTPVEVRLAITGRIPQMLPRVLRAPFAEVEKAIHKPVVEKRMPEEQRKDDPGEYEIHEIPGVETAADGTVSTDLTKRTRNWFQAVAYMQSRLGRWPNAVLIEKMTAHFGDEPMGALLANERTLKMAERGKAKPIDPEEYEAFKKKEREEAAAKGKDNDSDADGSQPAEPDASQMDTAEKDPEQKG